MHCHVKWIPLRQSMRLENTFPAERVTYVFCSIFCIAGRYLPRHGKAAADALFRIPPGHFHIIFFSAYLLFTIKYLSSFPACRKHRFAARKAFITGRFLWFGDNPNQPRSDFGGKRRAG